MTEWKKVKLGDVCKISAGGDKPELVTEKENEICHVPIYSNGVDNEGLYGFTDKAVIKGNSITITARGANVGTVFYRKSEFFPIIRLLSLLPDEEHINCKYLYYLIKDKSFLSTGSAQPQITVPNISNYLIKYNPDLATQRRIAEVLSRYDALIENYQRQIKLLEEAAQRLYKEWFVDLRFPGHETTPIINNLPQGWEKKKLIEIADVQYGYAFDGSLFNSDNKGMPIVRIRNIPDGYTSDYTTEDASPDYIVRNGDILVGMDGIFHINTWSGWDAYLVQRACSFRPKDKLLKGFILQAIYEPIKYFEKTLVGATVAHLGKKHIDSIELLIPTGNDLFIPFSEMFDERQNLLAQIRHLSEARDRLLPKLMNGEIEV